MEKSFSLKVNPLFRVIKDSRAQWHLLALVITLYLLAGLFVSLSATMLGNIVDFGTLKQIENMIETAVKLLLVVIVNSVMVLFQHRLTGIASESMFFNIRLRAFLAILSTKFSVLENDMRTSDVAVRVNANMDDLCESFAGSLSWFARVILQGIIALVSCLYISWQLTITYLLLIVISLYIIKKISIPLQKQMKATAESTGKSLNIALDMLNGLSVIKSFQIEQKMNERFEDHVKTTVFQNKKMQYVNFKMTLVKYLSGVIQLIGIIAIAFILITQGLVTVGQVITFIFLSESVGEAFGLSDRMFSAYRRAFSLAERVYEIIDLPSEKGGEELIANDSEYVSMKNITFEYKDGAKILDHVSMNLYKNQKIGIIGTSGSGKSTIIKLLCKFYDYESPDGSFLVFGQQIKKWGHTSLRSHLSIVTQDPLLFAGSVYDNVIMGNANATETDVIKALKDVQLWDFVNTMEKGIHSDIGEEGGALSGGQRQRLSIARAILKNADIILLDEPTSALDSFTDNELQKTLDALLEGKAAIIVSHRMSVLNKADYIYCLQNGKIIEEGSPDDLIDKMGYFYSIKMQQKLGDIHEGL